MFGVKPRKLELKSRVNCCPGGGDGDQRDITRPLTTASSPTNQCLSRMGIGEVVAAMLVGIMCLTTPPSSGPTIEAKVC